MSQEVVFTDHTQGVYEGNATTSLDVSPQFSQVYTSPCGHVHIEEVLVNEHGSAAHGRTPGSEPNCLGSDPSCAMNRLCVL